MKPASPQSRFCRRLVKRLLRSVATNDPRAIEASDDDIYETFTNDIGDTNVVHSHHALPLGRFALLVPTGRSDS